MEYVNIQSKKERKTQSNARAIAKIVDSYNLNIYDNDDLLFEKFLRLITNRNISNSYTNNILQYLFYNHREREFRDKRALLQERINDFYSGRLNRRSSKTDGIFIFEPIELLLMKDEIEKEIKSFTATTSDWRKNFLFVFYILLYTGKRLSEILLLSNDDVDNMIKRDLTVIEIPKTRRLGRIDLLCLDERREIGPIDKTLLNKLNTINLPIIKQRDQMPNVRKHLDIELRSFYKKTLSKDKPRGLSFHGLRRAYAGEMYLLSRNVQTIQNCLDHSSTVQTNRYINGFLNEFIK